MESKINYTLVGVFVVLLMTALISFSYWLGKHGGQQAYDYYHVYMSESVAGLSTDSSVKYQGVDVGTVEHIGLNPENSEQVLLRLKIQHNTPVKVDTTAALQSYGLTGLTFIELSGGKMDSLLLMDTVDGIPAIPTRHSTFARFDESLSNLTEKSIVALDKINQLLNEQNLNNVAEILLEMKLLAKDSREQMSGFKSLVDHSLGMEKGISQSFDKVASASVSVKKMADSLEKNSAEVTRNLSLDVSQSLEVFNQLLSELDLLAGYLQKTTQGIEASPSDLIFKRTQPKLGPGEEK